MKIRSIHSKSELDRSVLMAAVGTVGIRVSNYRANKSSTAKATGLIEQDSDYRVIRFESYWQVIAVGLGPRWLASS